MILFIDDIEEVVLMFAAWFKNYDFIATTDPNEAYQILRHKPIKLVITDFALGPKLGSDIADFARDKMGIPSIIITAHSQAVEDLKKRFEHVLLKPVDLKKVTQLVDSIIKDKKDNKL